MLLIHSTSNASMQLFPVPSNGTVTHVAQPQEPQIEKSAKKDKPAKTHAEVANQTKSMQLTKPATVFETPREAAQGVEVDYDYEIQQRDNKIKELMQEIEDLRNMMIPKDITEENKQRKLSEACRDGNLLLVKYLIEKKHCNPVISSVPRTVSPIVDAYNNGHLDVVKYLVDEVGVDVKNIFYSENSVDSLPVKNGLAIMKYLFEEKGMSPSEDLLFSVNNKDEAEYLIKKCRLDPHYQNSSKETCLFSAIRHNNLELLKYFIEEYDIDPNIRNYYGNTVLHDCAWYNDFYIVKYLVGIGVELNIKDNGDRTPLRIAKENQHDEIASYLQAHGAIE